MPNDEAICLLLVDDDPSILRVYGNALTRLGATVATASNGKDAALRVKAGGVDVVVSDISMPEMNGWRG
jgi:two-component system response regulator GlrR